MDFHLSYFKFSLNSHKQVHFQNHNVPFIKLCASHILNSSDSIINMDNIEIFGIFLVKDFWSPPPPPPTPPSKMNVSN